jgi:hypothetical protein
MKIRNVISVLVFILISVNPLLAQNKGEAMKLQKVVWFGVDFTNARFTLVEEAPEMIVNQYLKAINSLVMQEPEKFNIKKYFAKSEVIYSIDIALESNSKIDPSRLVIKDGYKLAPEEIGSMIKKYRNDENSGLGLVFIAENLNKITQTGSYYVCFFDIASKEIIDSKRMEAKAAGFGFRNYWAGSVYNIMKAWSSNK